MALTYTTPSTPQTGNVVGSIVYKDFFFMQNVRQMNFCRKLSQPFQQSKKAIMGDEGAVQSGNTWPIMMSTDLSKSTGKSGGGSGDQVTFDRLGRYNGVPIMGDVEVGYATRALDWSRDSVSIDLYNMAPPNDGGLMNSQRSPHDQELACMLTASTYFSDVQDNVLTIQACGGRGYDTGSGWQLPIETDPRLPSMVVNPILPPTLNRYYQPGGGTSLSSIPTSAVINLQFFDYLRTALSNSDLPLMGVEMADAAAGYSIGSSNSPLYLCAVTREMYYTIRTQAVNTGDWNTFVALTGVRASFTQHPLFRETEIGFWANFLFFVYGRPVTYPQGSTATEYTDSTSTTTRTVTVANRAQRGFILGAQALGFAQGNATPKTSGKIAKSGSMMTNQSMPYHWHSEVYEGAITKYFSRAMFGIKKFRYPYNINGVLTPFDANVATFDCYQPYNSQFSSV